MLGRMFDEMRDESGRVRPAYAEVASWLDRTPHEFLSRKREEAERLFRRIGVTFAVYTDGGDPERLIQFVKRCAVEFGLTGRWGFQYANTCSKPRLDGFGGGAHVLDLATGETVDWIYTDGWLAETIAGEGGPL